MLPSVDLNQVGSACGKAPYLTAHEELRAEVHKALVEHDGIGSFVLPALAVTFFVGRRRNDGRFRPEATHRASNRELLDPIYRAMIDAKFIRDTSQIALITVGVMPHCEEEGIRISIEELG